MIESEEIMKHLKTYLENIDAMGSCKSHMLPFLNIKGNNENFPLEEKRNEFCNSHPNGISVTNIVKKWWGDQWI